VVRGTTPTRVAESYLRVRARPPSTRTRRKGVRLAARGQQQPPRSTLAITRRHRCLQDRPPPGSHRRPQRDRLPADTHTDPLAPARRSDPRRAASRRRRRPATGRNGASRDRGNPGPRWVRTASGTAGPLRAPAVTAVDHNPRSHGIRRYDLGRRSGLAPGSNTTSRPRRLTNPALAKGGPSHTVWLRHSGQWSGFRPGTRALWNSCPQLPQIRTWIFGWFGPTALGREGRGCGLSFAL
jgi:hypothetical protein